MYFTVSCTGQRDGFARNLKKNIGNYKRCATEGGTSLFMGSPTNVGVSAEISNREMQENEWLEV